MRALVLLIFLTELSFSLVAADTTQLFQEEQKVRRIVEHINRADLIFFFDRITPKGTGWELKLSPNVEGMLWRVIGNDGSDITGGDGSGRIIEIPMGYSLSLIKKGTKLLLYHFSGFWHFDLVLASSGAIDSQGENRWCDIRPYRQGYALIFPED